MPSPEPFGVTRTDDAFPRITSPGAGTPRPRLPRRSGASSSLVLLWIFFIGVMGVVVVLLITRPWKGLIEPRGEDPPPRFVTPTPRLEGMDPARPPASQPDTPDTPPPAPRPDRSDAQDRATSEEVETLRTELTALSLRLEDLQRQFDSLEEDASTPDLRPLRAQVAALADLPEAVDQLSSRLEALEPRVAAAEAGMKSVQSDVSRLHDQVLEQRTGLRLDRAIELFDAGQFRAALDELEQLQQAVPEDARVWYYSALAHAFLTNDWQSAETEALFRRGIERERAGTPSSDVLNNTFADLSRARGREWVAFYRNQVNVD